jgi:hypothetical protein
MNTRSDASQLIRDLWSFIENVTDDDPERTGKFFALRERVRKFYLVEQYLEQSRPSNGQSPR